ncbi:helix-turn-helix domain-containing protein [Actinomadura macrotermitis]|uniref:HTH cro/C1-type domain-containing protein n=1 Tax=Actinomadura macrotermitis TaxID=2585200 RepID=A0A7K0C271_9ACTN|nr:helix-turn-helix transcriptional regulator [Actinomadura macrotermitis]MQY07567.1 hypothetical protein [Actinomadura macrotermitis]
MSTSRGPTVRQRRLGIELRRLREQNDLTGEEVAARFSWSTAKVSRLENARTGIRVDDVVELLKLYGVVGGRLEELVALAHDATRRGWWEEYSSLGATYAELIALESEASAALQWENLVVPGLLQTEAYARGVLAGWEVVATLTDQEMRESFEARMRRQEVLRGPQPMELSAVLDESILQRRVGDPATMAEQLDHLCQISRLPNVSLKILPLDTPRALLATSFTLLKFPRAHDVQFPDIVHTESLTLSFHKDDKETDRYKRAFGQLDEESLGAAETRELLAEARDHWLSRGGV